ncbi:MAG TPA: hypothetical protein VGH36_10370, partial [Acetobacteraceae bacterium]
SGLFVWLMAWRALPEGRRRDRRMAVTAALYGSLAVVSGLATAALEFAWYGLATKVNPWRVIVANETIARGLRPAHWVFVVAAALMVVFLIRRLMGSRQPMRRSTA